MKYLGITERIYHSKEKKNYTIIFERENRLSIRIIRNY